MPPEKHIKIDEPKGEVVLYKNKLEVRLEHETVWLSLNQIAVLFGRDKSVVSRHLRNIFETKELNRYSTVAFFATVQKEGGRPVERTIEYFNLDVIISVGYRVNSLRGTQFRIWATSVLRKHLVDGYTLNEKRLRAAEHKYQALQSSLKLLGNVMSLEGISDETKGLIKVISHYSRALEFLDDFDHERLAVPKGTLKVKYRLTYEKAKEIIEQMRQTFKSSGLFGREKDQSLKSSLGATYQSFSGKDLYPTVEEKAAHLLYFITKNHSFVDGNKRIAAALFICFLQGNGLLLRKDKSKRIEDNTLVALTLMIAASKPAEKNMMIKVILNLLK
ncbi:MAG: cytochrome C biogenesis protein CycH [Omnitrophica WOR_2 bacterium RIFCSPHIGHO2_02_FULL_52_10]|nr:MAG: cytochrome C biogenesis protein CycH [Omnitrophica WOR_2 bacterium RIFCSPHIGHO2_02_FULL_52_10]